MWLAPPALAQIYLRPHASAHGSPRCTTSTPRMLRNLLRGGTVGTSRDWHIGRGGRLGRMDMREACRVDVTGDIVDHLISDFKF